MAYTEEELFDMSDEELMAAMQEEKVEMTSPETEIEVEQSDEDSADSYENEEEHDSETVEDEDEPEAEEAEPEDEDSPEGEAETEEDNSDEAEAEVTNDSDVEEQKAEIEKLKAKANGQEFEFTPEEALEQFPKVFAQAANYTKKMQAIAPYRKMISALEDEGVTEEDMNLMIDALKGNKEAITALVKRTDVDVLDLDLESDNNYVPNSYGRDDVELRVKEVIDEIATDREYPITQNIVAEQWDEGSRDVFARNPELIKELHIDVVNGTFDKVSPLAMKMKVLDGAKKSDIEYYMEAGKQHHMQSRAAELQQKEAEEAQQRVQQVQQKQEQRTQVKQAAPKRKAATIPRKRVSSPKVTDYLEDSDEAFEEWYSKLQDSM